MESDAVVHRLLIGRSALLRALSHLKSPRRNWDYSCSLTEDGPDHISRWKTQGQSEGFDSAEEGYMAMIACPLCGSLYATFKAKKLLLGKIGRINGILTRMGNSLRKQPGDSEKQTRAPHQ